MASETASIGEAKVAIRILVVLVVVLALMSGYLLVLCQKAGILPNINFRYMYGYLPIKGGVVL